MQKLLTYVLKRGFYHGVRYNFGMMTEEECFEKTKTVLSRGISFCLIFMPALFIISPILGLIINSTFLPTVAPLLIVFALMFLIQRLVKKKLDVISLDELRENDVSIQKKLSLQYYWIVLAILGLYFSQMCCIRVISLSLRLK